MCVTYSFVRALGSLAHEGKKRLSVEPAPNIRVNSVDGEITTNTTCVSHEKAASLSKTVGSLKYFSYIKRQVVFVALLIG